MRTDGATTCPLDAAVGVVEIAGGHIALSALKRRSVESSQESQVAASTHPLGSSPERSSNEAASES